MTKVTLNDVGDLTNTTTAQNTINNNNDTVVAAFDNTLSLDGTSPNQMHASFDMNSNQIINLPAPATNTSPLRLQDLTSFIGGGTITNIPTGGTTGQILSKNSNTNFDTGWAHESTKLTAGSNIVITGTTPATIATSTNPTFIAPTLGTATATSINKVALTPPATGSTLAIPDGVTFTGPAASGTAMTLGNNETVTGTKTFNSGKLVLAGSTSGTTIVQPTAAASGTITFPASTGIVALTAGTIASVKKQVFTASGTYTPSAGMIYCIIEAIGGGGAGGGATGTASQCYNGAGGGSGSYSRLVATAATIGVSQTVTIGTAGAGSSGANGGNGGDTSVGALCIGKGGSGGGSSSSGGLGTPGSGGVAGTGDWTWVGTPGGPGYFQNSTQTPGTSGFGGGVFGGGAKGVINVNATTTAGNAGSNYGGGGSGASTDNIATAGAGGNGATGVVFITEFCNQ